MGTRQGVVCVKCKQKWTGLEQGGSALWVFFLENATSSKLFPENVQQRRLAADNICYLEDRSKPVALSPSGGVGGVGRRHIESIICSF